MKAQIKENKFPTLIISLSIHKTQLKYFWQTYTILLSLYEGKRFGYLIEIRHEPKLVLSPAVDQANVYFTLFMKAIIII